jgi:thiol-disulfide isomerase/thioredoxin
MSRFFRLAAAMLPFALSAQEPAPITVQLSPQVAATGTSLRWSPSAAKVELKAVGSALTGSFALGPAGAPMIAVKLVKAPGEPHYNTLWVDANRDGKLSDGEKLVVTPKEIRGKWWSSFDTIIDIPVPAGDGHAASMRPYPLALWYVEDPDEPKAPPLLRWSRRGWHLGRFEIGGKTAYALITEMHMDGRFDQRDFWALSRDSAALLKISDMRPMDRHFWLDGIAYRPVKIDPDGRAITMVPIQTGTTEAGEKLKDDIYLPDRDVARVPRLAFGKDLATVLAEAKRDNKRVLVDFEAVWCGPCHTMDTLVFTAKSVVAATEGTLPVKVDGDDHHDLKVKYKVEGYPTLILLDSNGKELRRGVGYQSIVQMLAMLKP